MASDPVCPLCGADGGVLVWQNADFRLVRAQEDLLPAFYRVVCNTHVAEFTALDPLQRLSCIDAVALTEQTLRDRLHPDKVNLASLGNVVPHLHWHVVARWSWDAYWPQSPWSVAQRPAAAARLDALREQLPAVDAAMRAAFDWRFGGAFDPCGFAVS